MNASEGRTIRDGCGRGARVSEGHIWWQSYSFRPRTEHNIDRSWRLARNVFSFVEKAEDENKKETNDLLGVGDKRRLGDRRRLEDVSENEAQEIPKKW